MITISRRKIIMASIVLFLYILIIPLLVIESAARKELGAQNARLKEMTVLSSEYKTISERISIIERRSAIARIDGVAQAIDSITSSIGIRGKVKSIRAAGPREIKGEMTEDSAEVQMEKISMNELVNLFYSIDNAPMMLAIRQALMKKSFENPELLDIKITIALFARK